MNLVDDQENGCDSVWVLRDLRVLNDLRKERRAVALEAKDVVRHGTCHAADGVLVLRQVDDDLGQVAHDEDRSGRFGCVHIGAVLSGKLGVLANVHHEDGVTLAHL